MIIKQTKQIKIVLLININDFKDVSLVREKFN
jgi:hypothetical protein